MNKKFQQADSHVMSILPANRFPNSPTLIIPTDDWVEHYTPTKTSYIQVSSAAVVKPVITVAVVDFLEGKTEYATSPKADPSVHKYLKEAFTGYLRANIPDLVAEDTYTCYKLTSVRFSTWETDMGAVFVAEKFAVIENLTTKLPYILTITGVCSLTDDDSIAVLSKLTQKIDFS